jgi:hypothetical protein
MADLAQYRQLIQDLLTQHAKNIWDTRIQAQTIFDLHNDHYQLVYVGWKGSERVYGVVLHLDIIDGKIWIQQDGTEAGIDNKLMELGVPASQLVIGCDPPMMRQYTAFATG